MTTNLSVKFIRDIYTYNPETGILSLRKDRGSRRIWKKGTEVGFIHENMKKNKANSYLRTTFRYSTVYVHRLIYVWMTGEQPEVIDHIDGNGLNNKWDNLRSVSNMENCHNQRVYSSNSSGHSGVTCRKENGRWRARIMHKDKSINLGTFENKEDAIEARKNAEQKYWSFT